MYDNSFKYPTNSNPRYIAGAVVYQLVYDKKGLKGFDELEKSGNTYESLMGNFSSIMGMREDKADTFLMNYIRQYHLK